MPIYKFPEGFKWGSATSAHQIEGDNHNDWTEWEKSPARLEQLKKEGKDPANFISGKACDSYNRYQEDFDIAKQLNQNIHRFSIEWSRIEPEEGRFDEKEMQHYINVVKALRDRGIEPMITLWHFTNPIWFAKKGGFLNIDSTKYFTRYVKYVVENLKDKVDLWITFNESTTIYSSFSYLIGLFPPQHKNIFEWRRANRNLVRSHIEAYKEIKKIYNQSPAHFNIEKGPITSLSTPFPIPKVMSHNVEVGITESNAHVVIGNNFVKRIIGKLYSYYRNLYFFTKAFPHYDFIGLNYYSIDRKVFKNFDVLPSQELVSSKNWEIYPKGIYQRLLDLKRFKKPIFITENGIPNVTDDDRIKFIEDHLYWIWKAIQDGADVRSYLYWSLLDNFEIKDGFSVRFGLVEIDYNTFERHIRPSALEYAKICRENVLNI